MVFFAFDRDPEFLTIVNPFRRVIGRENFSAVDAALATVVVGLSDR